MSARGKARKRAVDILFEADVRGTDATATLAARVAAEDPPVREYTVALVEGVTANRVRIDDLLATHSHEWTLDRMPAVDRNVLRVGVYEMLFVPDVPDAVAISEAVELVTELSTDRSPAFVNGLLARILTLKPTLSA
ncbi:MAG TPA: transcription antitermination factor NusB [Sporichthyaceae bacterium]|jgi:N utilization substance protein B|nr:transcription antitermination factor NusB [Sporichthyaceae bacterium]